MARPKKNADEAVTDSTQDALQDSAPDSDEQAPVTTGAKIRRQVTTEALNFSTLRMEPVVEVVEVEVAEVPASVTLDAPYGFYDDDQTYRFWSAGQVVTDSSEIALLIERGAVFKAE
jgi:hypothetical protein